MRQLERRLSNSLYRCGFQVIFAGETAHSLATAVARSLAFATVASTWAGSAIVGSIKILVRSVTPTKPRLPASPLLWRSYPSAPEPGPYAPPRAYTAAAFFPWTRPEY